ncbi:MAG: carboxymuconolactone decarboxylase family protein [Planctomycetota bacterium]
MKKPLFMELLEKGDPDLFKHVASVREFAGGEGALPIKVKTLMGMLVDAVLGHADGVRALAERARAQGATEAEIAETVRMAFLFGGLPGLVTATQAFAK